MGTNGLRDCVKLVFLAKYGGSWEGETMICFIEVMTPSWRYKDSIAWFLSENAIRNFVHCLNHDIQFTNSCRYEPWCWVAVNICERCSRSLKNEKVGIRHQLAFWTSCEGVLISGNSCNDKPWLIPKVGSTQFESCRQGILMFGDQIDFALLSK